jgi:membrane-bound metal-dependent hydrolase YbcI (DUF457 family)
VDTITHGLAGALLGKALCNGGPLFPPQPISRRRVVTWSLMLGAVVPDADALRDLFSPDQLLIVTWHRSVTHSLVCLPLFALLLAGLTRSVARRRKWEAPSLGALTAIYAIGIVSHIVLDLVTSFGTMIWTPINWSRPAWDLLFIIDFAFSTVVVIPQVLPWVYGRPEGVLKRSFACLSVAVLGVLSVARLAEAVGTPLSAKGVAGAMLTLVAVFLLPGIRGWGLKVSARAWNVAGLAVAVAYLLLAAHLHQMALTRVENFATLERIDVETLGALPFPPSIFHWDGLIRTPRGVYDMRVNLHGLALFGESQAVASTSQATQEISYSFYPDAFPNAYIETAKHLPEVQKVLWFSRFPVVRFHQDGNQAIVEIADLRFPKIRRGRPAPFTYRLRFGPGGQLLSKGWVGP